MDDAERAAQGMAVRREVLGEERVDRAVAATTPLTAPFQDFITRYAWGEIWSRPGLSRAERSMITLTALVVLRQEEELAMHVRAALRNGLTPGQIGEVLLHTAVYAGVPAANRAFAIARQVLAEAGETAAVPRAVWRLCPYDERLYLSRPHRHDGVGYARGARCTHGCLAVITGTVVAAAVFALLGRRTWRRSFHWPMPSHGPSTTGIRSRWKGSPTSSRSRPGAR